MCGTLYIPLKENPNRIYCGKCDPMAVLLSQVFNGLYQQYKFYEIIEAWKDSSLDTDSIITLKCFDAIPDETLRYAARNVWKALHKFSPK